VDEGDRPCPERTQGRIQFRGPSATHGYYRNPEATRGLIRDGWLETGDLGYLVDGALYVTGRVKDLIIRGGRNLYPQELEEIVGDLPGIRKGCVAAFGCPDETRGTERLVIVAETRRPEGEHKALIDLSRAALRLLLQGEPDDIVLIPPRTIPKTSSGKIRRGECKERYLSGTLLAASSGWRERGGLLLRGLAASMRSATAAAFVWLYAAHFWIVPHAFMFIGWWGVLLTPGLARRRRLHRAVTQLSLRLVRIPVVVTGGEHLTGGRRVAVANHQSYLDTVVMSSLAPETFFFTPKRDLEKDFVARILMDRLDCQFMDRLDPKAGVADLEAVKERLRQGESAVVYPEGIFYAEPGLRHFYTGAFAVAAETQTQVVPIAIQGTRAIWRGERPFARHGAVTVTIGPPILPGGSDWENVVRLRKEARAFIAAHCGEPDVTG
jgi:1-acyl-sn-glycerol-3-phosphate acyltransferase